MPEYPCDQCPLFSDCQDTDTPEIPDDVCPLRRLEAGLPEWPAPAIRGAEDLPPATDPPAPTEDGEPFTPALPLVRPRAGPRPRTVPVSEPPRTVDEIRRRTRAHNQGVALRTPGLPRDAHLAATTRYLHPQPGDATPARPPAPPWRTTPPQPAPVPDDEPETVTIETTLIEVPTEGPPAAETVIPRIVREMKRLWDEGLNRGEIAAKLRTDADKVSAHKVSRDLTRYYGILPRIHPGTATAPVETSMTFTPADRATIQRLLTQNDEILRLLRGGLRFTG